MFKEQNPSMGDQVKKQEIERAEMDNNALLELLQDLRTLRK